MDPHLNPFAPGAGSQPPELAGREEIIAKARLVLERIRRGRHEKSLIVVGLRGVGKTVVLNRIREVAEEIGIRAIQIEATEERNLLELLIPRIQQALLAMDRGEKVLAQVKRALRALASFVKVTATVEGVEFGLGVDPEIGTADTGDLELDLPDLFEAVGLAARARETTLCLIIDEMQYASEPEMSALIMALHRVSQRNLPIVLVGGGLPQILGLAGRSKSYAERLFDYPRLDPLDRDDTFKAIREPIEREGAAVSGSVLAKVFQRTNGYPYFVQEWGYQIWNEAPQSPIDDSRLEIADERATARLDESFFRVRFDRLTPVEQKYMFAMAKLGPGPHRSGDVANEMGREIQSVAPHRSSLIRKGMIYSPAHGDVAFTVPMFDEYLNRVASGASRSQPRLT
ncbi:MAG TPA: ATP-binding protein [Rhizobiaceae bacterium]|nr:ATP-binding protein [Rhizobiaceae bacterium]